METQDSIFFYSNKGNFYFLSNFYPVQFTENDITFENNEQYFMYQKCITFDKNNTILLQNILDEKDPKIIKKLGRKVRNFDDKVWNDKKYNIMKQGLFLKFSQNKDIKQKLLETKPKILYEASPRDKIWGIGVSISSALNKNQSLYGKNLLGNALMEIRDMF